MPTTTKFVKELYNEDLVYSSVLFGMGFWIDDQGLFISAPEFKDGSLDVDNAIPVCDWENFSELTDGQLEYLQELVMFGYEMEVPEQKGWDVQTYDNLVDEVMK